MGLMYLAKQYRLTGAVVKTLPDSGGPAVVVIGSDGNGDAMTAELWGPPGVWSVPPDNTFGARLPVGGGNFGVVAATHHYKTPSPVTAKGETAVGSTTPDGLTVKAVAIARADGTWEINGSGKRLVLWDDLTTALATFLTALKAHLTAAGDPSAGTLTLDISATKTTTLKTGG